MDKLKFYENMYLKACVRFNEAERKYDGSIYNWYNICYLGDIKNRWLRLCIMRSMKAKGNKGMVIILNNFDLTLIGGQ